MFGIRKLKEENIELKKKIIDLKLDFSKSQRTIKNKDEEITLYRLIADTTGWYIIALIVGVVTAGIVAIIAYTKKSKSKKAINAELSVITNIENKN